MKTSSCKAKGRRLAQEVKELLLRYAPDLKPDDVMVTPSGMTGPDLHLSPAARQRFPLVIECKCQESVNIWKAFEQAKSHLAKFNLDYGFYVPILFFRRNRSEMLCTLTADDFVKLIG